MKRKALAGHALVTRLIGFTRGLESFTTLTDPLRPLTDTLDVAPPRDLSPPLFTAATLDGWMCGPLGVDPPLHHRCRFFARARAFSSAGAKGLPGFALAVTPAEGSWRTAPWCRGRLPGLA